MRFYDSQASKADDFNEEIGKDHLSKQISTQRAGSKNYLP